ncbi:ATP-dependent DNA helicase [Trichonephila clavata]|uniref:ATP-dependent DNA helicase n=1 Tax=Trichonephila clavata TaxID=2740835 RepID=A0A8X6KVA1_TRICU|nr:ATP-dependent DNA helicase [Trichonephila clavata]
MNVCCNYCKALRWKNESKGICCSSGKVRLDSIQQPPEPLKSLLCGEHDQSQHFLNNIRRYNSAFQMTSFGAKEVHEGNYMSTFKIQGQLYHLIGSLLPVDNARESFLQIYFISDYGTLGTTKGRKITMFSKSALCEDGYPFYRRRSPENGGIRTTIRSRANCIDINNRWIVPFSPVLSCTFRAHINVELCSSVKSIKYICKYVNKGSDLAVFGVQNANDEVTSYQNGRYISTSEAIWRILSFSIHERFPAVTHLDIHLENGQREYFDPSNVRGVVENPRNTTLMAFFDLCQNDEFAASLLYEEIPGYYTFNKQNG